MANCCPRVLHGCRHASPPATHHRCLRRHQERTRTNPETGTVVWQDAPLYTVIYSCDSQPEDNAQRWWVVRSGMKMQQRGVLDTTRSKEASLSLAPPSSSLRHCHAHGGAVAIVSVFVVVVVVVAIVVVATSVRGHKCCQAGRVLQKKVGDSSSSAEHVPMIFPIAKTRRNLSCRTSSRTRFPLNGKKSCHVRTANDRVVFW